MTEEKDKYIVAWEYLIEQTKEKNSLIPGEKTKRQFAEEVGISLRKARTILDNLVEAGEWSVRKVIVDGKETNAYKPIIKP
jgi:hypothetical protein